MADRAAAPTSQHHHHDRGRSPWSRFGVAPHALDLSGLRTGSTAAVIGCGPIGLLLVQLALAAGAARVVAVDPLEHRRHAALAFGAALALAAEDLSDRGATVDAVGHLGVDVAFEVAGVNDAVEQAIAMTMPGGRVVLIGIPVGDRTSFRASVARRKGLTPMMARRMKEDVYPRGIRLVEQGRVDASSVVTHRFSLNRVEDAFAQTSSRAGLKVVVHRSQARQRPRGHRVAYGATLPGHWTATRRQTAKPRVKMPTHGLDSPHVTANIVGRSNASRLLHGDYPTADRTADSLRWTVWSRPSLAPTLCSRASPRKPVVIRPTTVLRMDRDLVRQVECHNRRDERRGDTSVAD